MSVKMVFVKNSEYIYEVDTRVSISGDEKLHDSLTWLDYCRI